MKFLHTADLHLDSAFCASSPTEGFERRARQRKVLQNIFALAKKEECQMVLISGDLFDTPYVTPETRKACIDCFADFGGPVVISPGNHDPYIDGSFYKDTDMPENVYIFSSNEIGVFDFYDLEVTVMGYGFTSPTMTSNPLSSPLPVRHNQRTLLLCAHADVDSPLSSYAPISSSALQKHGFAYGALGHIHKHSFITESIAYCGFPEGRSFDEQGEGGVIIVTADGVSPTVTKRIAVSSESYLIRQLSVEGTAEPRELFDAVDKCTAEYTSGGVHLRLELVGCVSEEVYSAIHALKSRRPDFLESLEVINSALCLPDKDALQRDTTLKGEFYRSLLPSLSSDDEKTRKTAIKALYIGLCAMDGKDFTSKENL